MPTRYTLDRPDGMEPEVGLFYAMLEDATRDWTEELGEAGPEAMSWQPFENGHSIGGELLHIAAVEIGWIHETICGKDSAELKRTLNAEEIDVDAVKWPAVPKEPIAWYLDKLKSVRARTREVLMEVRDPGRIIARPRWDAELSVRWILSHVVQHDAYHGGQAVLLKILHDRA